MKTYFVLGLGCRLQNEMSTIISFMKISIITQLMVTRIGLIFTSILTTKAFHLHLESLLGLHLSMTVGIKDHTQEINPTRTSPLWYQLCENLNPTLVTFNPLLKLHSQFCCLDSLISKTYTNKYCSTNMQKIKNMTIWLQREIPN